MKGLDVEGPKDQFADHFPLSEQILNTMLLKYPGGIVLLRGNSIAWVNVFASKSLGFEKFGFLEGKSRRPFFSSDEEYYEVLGRCKSEDDTDLPEGVNTRIMRQDGSFVDLKVRLRIVDDSCSEKATILNLEDITDHVHARKALNGTHQNYCELVEFANSIILRWDRHGKIVFMNKFGSDFFGYTEDELVGKNVVGLLIPRTDHAGRDLELMIREIATYPERYIKNQNENIRRNGERVWISWTNRPIFDRNGVVSEILSIGNDHTELKKAEDELVRSKKDLEIEIGRRTAELRASKERLEVELRERKAIEEELKRTEVKYRQLFENAPVGMMFVNKDGEIMEINKANLMVLGSPGIEHTKKINMLAFPPLIEAGISEHYRVCLKEGKRVDFEKPYTTKWGKETYLRTVLTPSFNSRDEVEGCHAVIEDVSFRKRAESALRASEQKYRMLHDNAPIGIALINTEGKILEVNRFLLDLLGSPGADATKAINVLTFSPMVEAGISDQIRAVMADKKIIDAEFPYMSKWGKNVFLRTILAPEMNEDGQVSGCLAVMEDISRRKVAEEALRISESKFRTLFETTQDSIFIKDLEFRYVDINPAGLELFQAEHGQIMGKTSREFFGENYPADQDKVERRVLKGETVETYLNWDFKSQQISLDLMRFPLRNSQGEIIGICGIAREVFNSPYISTSQPALKHDFKSDTMRSTLGKANLAAETDSIVLLTGETGSGKDYLARYIHELSARSAGPFYAINCAAIPPELAESELFGHEAGAYTHALRRKKGMLELAEGGTLLLNEIGELTSLLQAKLLTFLDSFSLTRIGGEKSINVNTRIIAATNRDLWAEVSEGRFRKDLYYRLGVISIKVPPLRERIEDIPNIANRILIRLGSELKLSSVPDIRPDAMRAMCRYEWPGNVRELRNVLERALMLSKGETIGPAHLGMGQMQWIPDVGKITLPRGGCLNDVVGETERVLIEEALSRAEGKKLKAAQLLGISRFALNRHMARLGIS